jgi:hypothetical protein
LFKEAVSVNKVVIIKQTKLRWKLRTEHMNRYKNAYKILVGKLRDNKQHGRCRSRWEDNIKMDLI